MPQEKLVQSPVFNNGVATPKHDEMLLMFSKDSPKLREYLMPILRYKISETIISYCEDYKRKNGFCDFGFIPKIRQINLTEWTPERPIMNNGYYIGSVDLYVLFKIKIDLEYKYYSEHTGYKSPDIENEIINIPLVFEFKPELKSFSETLRQVKIYQKHILGNYFVITNSDISKFQNIFESQGIKIYNP